MPIASKDIDNGLGHIWTGWGTLTADEIVDLYSALLSQDEEKQRAYRFNVSDFTAVTRTEVPTSAVRQIAQLSKAAYAINPDGIVTVVAEQDVLFGLARMWSVLVGEPTWETMIFRNAEDASAWIRERLEAKYGIENLNFT